MLAGVEKLSSAPAGRSLERRPIAYWMKRRPME